MKEYYELKLKTGEKIKFEFSYAGFKEAQKYIMDHDELLEHPFNDERVTIYYRKDVK